MKFDQVISSFGFKKNIADQCVYHKFKGSRLIFLVLCVDDILLVSNDIDLDLELYQMDIKTVFLNGDIAEEIYMVQPDSFEAKGSLVTN